MLRALAIFAVGLTASLSGCAPAGDEHALGEEQAAIVGGASDVADPAVVVLYIVDGQEAFLCSASVIAPRLLLTAAHCVSDKLHSPQTKYYAYLGDDFAQANGNNVLPVSEVHAQPAWDPDQLPAGHDVGVAILAAPIDVPPLPIRRAALTNADLGQGLRILGYGATNGTTQVGSGVKRQAQTALDDYDDATLQFTDAMHLTCNGDSGGPALMMSAGVEQIAGITSYGDATCAQFGVDTRVDAELAFVDQYLAEVGAPVPSTTAPTPDLGGEPSTTIEGSSTSTAATIETPKKLDAHGGCSVGGAGAQDRGVALVALLMLATRRRRALR